jgi:hypothetical protein
MPMCLMAEAARCLYVHHVELTFLFVAKNINTEFPRPSFRRSKALSRASRGKLRRRQKSFRAFHTRKALRFSFLRLQRKRIHSVYEYKLQRKAKQEEEKGSMSALILRSQRRGKSFSSPSSLPSLFSSSAGA